MVNIDVIIFLFFFLRINKMSELLQASTKFFDELETILKEEIPPDIARILCECGFETKTAILKIAPADINEIEQYVNEDLSMLKNTSYEGVSHFKLKPGHRLFILDLPNRINCWNETNIRINSRQCNITDFSYILRTFIETVGENYGKEPKGFRYNETSRYFSLFIYLMCGKACYALH